MLARQRFHALQEDRVSTTFISRLTPAAAAATTAMLGRPRLRLLRLLLLLVTTTSATNGVTAASNVAATTPPTTTPPAAAAITTAAVTDVTDVATTIYPLASTASTRALLPTVVVAAWRRFRHVQSAGLYMQMPMIDSALGKRRLLSSGLRTGSYSDTVIIV